MPHERPEGTTSLDERVLVMTPTGGDASAVCAALQTAGFTGCACTAAERLERMIDEGAAALLVAEEALTDETLAALSRATAAQPEWSDLPVIVLTLRGAQRPDAVGWTRERVPAGNMTLLERPCSVATLVSAVRVALRSRRRQYQLRTHLARRRAAEYRFSLVEQATDLGVWYCDLPFGRLDWNAKVKEHFWLPPEAEVTIETFWQRIHPEDRAATRAAMDTSIQTGGRFDVEYRTLSDGGTVRWVRAIGSPGYDASGTPVRFDGITLDVTQRKLAERAIERHTETLNETVLRVTAELERSNQALRLAERMAALGTFAAGLGHDLANLLMPLRTRLGLLLERPDLPRDAREDLLALSRPADYLAMLTRGLRHFAADPDQGWDDPRTDLGIWHQEVSGLLRTVLPRGVELAVERCDGLPTVAVPTPALTQAVLNLVHNAKDAIVGARGEGATGRVVLECADAGEGRVRVTVRDDGSGMTEEARRRCLEPFFTTKTRQRGTGLGLAMVHGIVQRAGGSVEIESAPGVGTAISLVLPASREGPAATATPARRVRLTLRDPRLEALVRTLVSSAGMQVLCNGSPEATDSVWITEPRPELLGKAEEFMEAGGGRRVIVLGGDERWAGAGAVSVDRRCVTTDLRRVLGHTHNGAAAASA